MLRVAFAYVNREANDDHMEVIQLMLRENRLVEREDCWECFQPKLYYSLVILTIRSLGLYPNHPVSEMIITAQMINAILGIALIAIVWAFLKSIPIQNDPLKIIAFALTAFNPKMIGMNAQATNDTLAILLSVLSIYFILLFLREEKNRFLIACIISVSLGLATKTNVLVTAVAITISLFIKAYTHRRRQTLISLLAFLLSIIFLSGINPLGQYQINYQKYGSIATMNRGIQRHPFPYIFEKTYIERPGITSIADGFFTFKYINLLQYPRMTNDLAGYYPAHRTSFWTHLYAYAHSVHFDNWPYTWESSGHEYFALTRAIFIFALPPSLMILIGAGINLAKFLSDLFKKSSSMLRAADYGLFGITFWGHIAFLILYVMMYRDFSLMKTIYIYPALLSFLIFFTQTGNIFKENKWGITTLSAISTILVVLYIADITSMIIHLQSHLIESR